LDNLKPGDFLLIQFGHNDGGAVNDASRARGTLRGVGEETQEIDNMLTKQKEVVHTYGWYLRQYIREARAKGATPVLCSLIPRNDWVEEHKMKPRVNTAQFAKQVAEQEKAGFIDLKRQVPGEARSRRKIGGNRKVLPRLRPNPTLDCWSHAETHLPSLKESGVFRLHFDYPLADKPPDPFPSRRSFSLWGILRG
jgi:hypothetical protein